MMGWKRFAVACMRSDRCLLQLSRSLFVVSFSAGHDIFFLSIFSLLPTSSLTLAMLSLLLFFTPSVDISKLEKCGGLIMQCGQLVFCFFQPSTLHILFYSITMIIFLCSKQAWFSPIMQVPQTHRDKMDPSYCELSHLAQSAPCDVVESKQWLNSAIVRRKKMTTHFYN